MAALGSVVSMYQTLIKEWTKKPVNLDNVGKLLTQLKCLPLLRHSFDKEAATNPFEKHIQPAAHFAQDFLLALTELQFMPTTGANPSPQELVVARDVLEIGVQWSIEKKDIPSFERYMSQLKCYYFDYSGILAESPYLYQLLGLNLMCLLAQNRLAEFHTELELLPPKQLQENIYIRCPVALEQYLMEGNYNKVFLSKGNVPAVSYHFFINILLNTLRDEVAVCIEKSYDQISQKEACRMLFFDNQKDLLNYTNQRNWQKDNASNYTFKLQVQQKRDIPSLKIIEQCLGYAKELERIV